MTYNLPLKRIVVVVMMKIQRAWWTKIVATMTVVAALLFSLVLLGVLAYKRLRLRSGK